MQSTCIDSCCQSQTSKQIKGPAMLPLEAGCIEHSSYGTISISTMHTCKIVQCVHCIIRVYIIFYTTLGTHMYRMYPYVGFMKIHLCVVPLFRLVFVSQLAASNSSGSGASLLIQSPSSYPSRLAVLKKCKPSCGSGAMDGYGMTSFIEA